MALACSTTNSTAEAKTPILLSFINGNVFTFNVDDYMQIRSEHNIVGSLVGTCSTRGWTPNANGLPAYFTPCESQLLLDKGIAVLKRMCADRNVDKSEYKEWLEKRAEEQCEHLKAKKLEESLKVIDKIVAGKRKKLLKSGVAEADIKIEKEDVIKELKDAIPFDRNNLLLEIPYESLFEQECELLTTLNVAGLKYDVFKDLWERGLFLTSGEAFGADFIAYPGDPMMFHASHIVIVLKDPKLKPLDLIAKVRMSVIVNKKCLFAYKGRTGGVSYQTVEWEGSDVGGCNKS